MPLRHTDQASPEEARGGGFHRSHRDGFIPVHGEEVGRGAEGDLAETPLSGGRGLRRDHSVHPHIQRHGRLAHAAIPAGDGRHRKSGAGAGRHGQEGFGQGILQAACICPFASGMERG